MSVERADVQKHLVRILNEESALLTELESLLQQENTALKTDDMDAINAVGATRLRCVQTLAQLDSERADLGQMLSFGRDKSRLEQMLSWAGPNGGLLMQWRANLDIARRCKLANDRNGALVTAKLGRVRKLLGTIRGTGPAPVYNRSGSRYSGMGARNLGSA